MTSITLTEIIPQDKLYDLSFCANISEEEKSKIQKLFNKVIKSNGINTVEYVYKNRLTAKGVSLQYLSRQVRSYLCKGEMTDLDMKCCAINILYNIVKKYDHIFYANELTFIKKLRFERDDIIDDIIDKFDITKSEAKVQLNKLLFGDAVNVEWLSQEDIHTFNSIKSKVATMKELKYIKDTIKKDVYNYEGKRLAQIIFKIESQIVECAVSYLTNKRHKIETIIFDGFHIRNDKHNEPAISQDEIEALQEHIKSNLEMETEWIIKDFEDTKSLTFDKSVIENHPPPSKEGLDQVIFVKFLKWAQENQLLRLKDKCITLKKVNEYHAEPLYENVNITINNFITQSKSNTLFQSSKIGKYRKMLEEFINTNQPSEEFEVVELNTNYFGYKNGLYDIINNTFITNDFPKGVLCRKYFDVDFVNKTAIDPVLYKIYKDQRWTDDTINLGCALLGRSFFQINTLEDWGVIMCLVGVSSTGKSTSIECVSGNCTYVETIDTKNNSFNLDSCDKAELIIVEEAENLPKRLDVEQFKGLARGEKIKINGKYTTAYTTQWKPPILLSSNDIINYSDTSGAIANRLLYFKFETILPEKDPKIKKYLHENGAVLVPFFINKYHEFLQKHDKTLVLPTQVRSWNDSITTENDIFHNWIHGCSDDLYWCVRYKEGSNVTVNEMKDKWKKHYAFGLKKKDEPPNIGINETAKLGELGIFKKEVMVCRYCEKRHIKGCCDKYERTHRKNKVLYTNCEFVPGKLNKFLYVPDFQAGTSEVQEDDDYTEPG